MPRERPSIAHVLETSLYVEDLERSASFYTELFGFPVFFQDSRMCALGVPGAQVLLLFRKGATQAPARTSGGTIPGHGGSGELHLCFAIEAEQLERWEEALTAAAIPVESRVHWPRGGVSLYLRDPDGHSLELATPGVWPNR
ncbi:MAG: VOC family protein [Acidobacteriia bacterium]|nr:VOC family protein [Methyloceanibacter sp.]MCL6490785.1 VOC family protein [Terriglobia bacterium]